MHAAQHLGSNYITRFDFSDFFPSISAATLRKFFLEEMRNGVIELDASAINAIIRLVCRAEERAGELVLSIGAPSSPYLSNAILYYFDKAMDFHAHTVGGIYTRYADDIYLSGCKKEVVARLEHFFQSEAAKMLPYLKVNIGKTQRLSRKRRMAVTGINLTPQRRLSVGRDLKRSLKTKVHLALQGQIDSEEMSNLRGMIAYVASVEPAFFDSLGKKFGINNIGLILDARGTEDFI